MLFSRPSSSENTAARRKTSTKYGQPLTRPIATTISLCWSDAKAAISSN